MKRLIIALSLVVAGLGIGGNAKASDHTPCGYGAPSHNMPNGAVFLSSGAGPVKDTLGGVNEKRSHSGISHGGWSTHSTMYEPSTRDWDDSETSCGLAGDWCCQGPLKGAQLQNGYPGMSQIPSAGLYTFYYLSGAAVDFIYYQRSLDAAGNVDGRGAAVASWLWSSSNYSSANTGAGTIYRVGFTGGANTSNYSFYQYRDYQGINQGATPWNNGDVCSTSLAYGQYKSGYGAINNNRSWAYASVPGVPNSYAHTYVVSGLNALYNAVYRDCNDAGDLLSAIGSLLCGGEDICDDAARQVTGCFADGKDGYCYSDQESWPTARWAQIRDSHFNNATDAGGPIDANGYATAQSVSPDNIGGWSGWNFDSLQGSCAHATNVTGAALAASCNPKVGEVCRYDGYCCSTSWDGTCANEAGGTGTHSVWSRDGNQGVVWNSPGSVYGCFY